MSRLHNDNYLQQLPLLCTIRKLFSITIDIDKFIYLCYQLGTATSMVKTFLNLNPASAAFLTVARQCACLAHVDRC